mmetsp:Transcript_6378/g.7943  ORF Transcript_6378/g.7943 Transcript_6378/m.7943 type:complete len:266 (+) Transcript_6378:73-870(+)
MPKRFVAERPDDLVRLHVADPSPLGLFGLAMGCLLLFCVDFKATKGALMMIPWILYLPALLQGIAGFFDYIRHNIFGATAFMGYAFFWFGLGTTMILEQFQGNNEDIVPHPVRQHTGIMAIGYLIFSILLTILSLGTNRVLLGVLISIDYSFLMLILHIFIELNAIALGIGLVFVMLFSLYGFTAVLLLKMAGGEVLPLGKPLIIWSKYIIHDKTKSVIVRPHKMSPKVKTITNGNDTDGNNTKKHYGKLNTMEIEVTNNIYDDH